MTRGPDEGVAPASGATPEEGHPPDVSARQRAALVSRLRAMPSARRNGTSSPPSDGESGGARCELCPMTIGEGHHHLLHLDERRIVCVCNTCWAMRSGDPEFRPTGNRTLWLDELDLSDEVWGRFAIPIGLAFFFHSAPADRVLALYPSPAGATECELDLDGWAMLVAANPILETLQPDVEGLIVDRMSTPHRHAIVPIDRCYELVGRIKASWEGISGGSAVSDSVGAFFADLRRAAAVR